MISYDVTALGQPLERVERPTPQPRGHQVLLRVLAAGVCHSDLHIWHGSYDLGNGKTLSMQDRGMKLPLTMGHEVAGEVVAVGDAVKDVRIGKNYVVYPWHGCGECKVCKRGDENLCMAGRSMGIYQPGGYADHVLVAQSRYLIDIGTMSPVQAAPYACSGLTTYSAIRKINPQVLHDEKVVLFGAGGLGLMAIVLIKALGGAGVIVVDPDQSKHAAALQAGADVALDPRSPDFIADAKKAAGGAVWAVVDCVGSGQTVQAAIDMLSKGGHLVQIGLFGGHVDMPTPFVPLRALTWQGSYVGNPRELQELIQLVRDQQLPPVPTRCMHLSKAFTALLELERGGAVGRLILTPEPA